MRTMHMGNRAQVPPNVTRKTRVPDGMHVFGPHAVPFLEARWRIALQAGLVPVTIREANGKITTCDLSAPQPLFLGTGKPSNLPGPGVHP